MRHIYLLLIVGLLPLALQADTANKAVFDSVTMNADAPAELNQYGQLVGHWECISTNLQQDGTWKESPGKASWSWYYTLGGYAVQDIWQPAVNPQAKSPNPNMGTNLRTYDPETKLWNIIWTTSSNPTIEHFRSNYVNEELHIFAERPKSKAFPSHLMHITFYNISEKHFDWKYESSGLADGQNWNEFSRLSCDRID